MLWWSVSDKSPTKWADLPDKRFVCGVHTSEIGAKADSSETS